MSIEQALAANTAALQQVAELLARLAIPTGALPIMGQQVVKAGPATTPVAAKVERPDKAPPELAGGKTAAQAVAALDNHTAVVTDVTYDQVKDKIVAVSKAKGRPIAVAVLARMGVSAAPQLKPAAYAETVDLCDRALKGEDMTASMGG